jgi:hypothetical protein
MFVRCTMLDVRCTPVLMLEKLPAFTILKSYYPDTQTGVHRTSDIVHQTSYIRTPYIKNSSVKAEELVNKWGSKSIL